MRKNRLRILLTTAMFVVLCLASVSLAHAIDGPTNLRQIYDDGNGNSSPAIGPGTWINKDDISANGWNFIFDMQKPPENA